MAISFLYDIIIINAYNGALFSNGIHNTIFIKKY